MKLTLRRFWIQPPAADGEPVGPIRWLAFEIGKRLYSWGNRLQRWAIDPDDDIPF